MTTNTKAEQKAHSANHQPQNVTVYSPQGIALGENVVTGDSTVSVFKGIPYALPPIGSRRWKPAEAAPSWKGERLATAFGPSPIQQLPTDKDSLFYYPSFPTSEDCLYLNVWTPCDFEASQIDKYPVMVWFYGGGLLVGSTHMPVYDGAALASKGVVVVTVNYRLDVFGYFSHPALSEESPNKASGNYGLTDQVQSLKWVQENIAAFGGDPDSVTVFGESAGALSVSHLLASPLSKGLFHKAIMQSAYLPPMPLLTEEAYGMPSAEAYGESFGQSIEALTLEELRALPAEVLLKAAGQFEFDKTVVDGWSLEDQIFETFEQGKQHDVPVLAGFNSHEGSYFGHAGIITPPATEQDYIDHIEERYGELANDYLAVYPPDDLYRACYASIGEGLYGWATEKLVSLMDTVSSDAFLFYLEHHPAWAAELGWGAFHGCDVNYVFNTIQQGLVTYSNWPTPDCSAREITMANVISDYWVAFATTGTPSVAGQPQWLPYSPHQQHHMAFKDSHATPGQDIHKETFTLHETIINKRRANNQSWSYKDIGYQACLP